ncbi:polysaccharide deacetylase family protein [Dysgonomonas reticulitermitis]
MLHDVLPFHDGTTGKRTVKKKSNTVTDAYGATVRIDTTKKVIHLIFSADSVFEGAASILKTLDKNKIKASFFLTGNCLRMKEHEAVIKEIVKKGHYIGGHSDKHLLYAPWGAERNKSLVSADSLINDFHRNMAELAKFGIDISKINYYLPPFEWYNRDHVRLIESQGQVLINFTSGLRTAADYTTPDMKNYMSSQKLIDQLYAFEKENNLNGSIILIHPGTHVTRTDKLYLRLDEIIKTLKKQGYSFERL